MSELGIAKFDYARLFEYVVHQMKKLGAEVTETNTMTVQDSISVMVNDLMPRILTTNEYRDGRDARGPEYGNRSHQVFAGRYISGTGTKDVHSGRLYIVKKEMRDWCAKHRMDPSAMVNYAKTNGFLVEGGERFNLTRGTEYAAVQVSCVVFDMNIMSGTTAVTPKLVIHTTPMGIDAQKQQAV
jgi:hypothetical protein